MVLRVAGADTVADYPAGSVVELETRDALRLISGGYADGVQAGDELEAEAETKPRKRAAKRGGRKPSSDPEPDAA